MPFYENDWGLRHTTSFLLRGASALITRPSPATHRWIQVQSWKISEMAVPGVVRLGRGQTPTSQPQYSGINERPTSDGPVFDPANVI
jgi:hypothetical protein